MSYSAITLRSRAAIVFEGLDRTGKSTQLRMLEDALERQSAVFAHMPSGFVPFTQLVYDALEAPDEKPVSGLAQQLAHLACHAESMPHLVEAMRSKALILDRWWWSTLAYGWYGGSVEQSGFSEQGFRELIQAIWQPITPSLIFVFLTPHQIDSNNKEGVEAGYRELLEENVDLAVTVPSDDADTTHRFIVDTLIQRELAHNL